MPPVQVLVVDDFEPWRRVVSSTLELMPERVVIYHASDGLEAIQKALELQPDLILLDIGLPRRGWSRSRSTYPSPCTTDKSSLLD